MKTAHHIHHQLHHANHANYSLHHKQMELIHKLEAAWNHPAAHKGVCAAAILIGLLLFALVIEMLPEGIKKLSAAISGSIIPPVGGYVMGMFSAGTRGSADGYDDGGAIEAAVPRLVVMAVGVLLIIALMAIVSDLGQSALASATGSH